MEIVDAIDRLIDTALERTEATLVHMPGDRQSLIRHGKFVQANTARKLSSTSSDCSIDQPSSSSCRLTIKSDDFCKNKTNDSNRVACATINLCDKECTYKLLRDNINSLREQIRHEIEHHKSQIIRYKRRLQELERDELELSKK